MKIVIAPDSYKESLTAKQVCQAIAKGFSRIIPDADYVLLPVADGGEGTVQSLVDATGGEIKALAVSGPLGVAVDAFYGVLGDDSHTAVIEMAAASGLHHVPMPQRDPKITSSYGTGELILAALNGGAKRLIIGLGGSATNDAGIGMMAALGVKFLDDQQCRISPCGGDIKRLASIDVSEIDPRLQSTEILVACDVDNPLCGPDGATYTFGPQKGGREDDLQALDKALLHFGNIVYRDLGRSVMDVAGGGAAGGMAAAFLAFTNAVIKPGIDLVLEAVNFTDVIADCDLIITGEGRIDAQTAHGKTPMGVAQRGKQFDIPVIAIAGCLGSGYQAIYDCGIDSIFAIVPAAIPLQKAFAEAEVNLTNSAENIARLYCMANASVSKLS